MTTLFDRGQIKDITLKNRFVRSATWNGMAEKDGYSTREIDALLKELALGGVGLIVTGHAYISRNGQAGPGQLGVHNDKHIEGLSRMTDVVHDAEGKIILQISHAGCHAATSLTGMEASGPSIMNDGQGPFCVAMTGEDIARVVSDFGYAALRAREAGFDGIQLHGAHGYLLSQFLSSFYNKREDSYGGSIENRTRIVLEILQKIKSEVGSDYPVTIKLNSEDFVDGGLTVDDMVEAAVLLESADIDAIELSGGTRYSGKYGSVRQGLLETEAEEVYYRHAALQYKMRCKTPLMLVGGIRSYNVAEQLIEENVAEYISLSRPLIRESGLINRWQAGDTGKAACISCNLCMKAAREEHHLYCVALSRQKK